MNNQEFIQRYLYENGMDEDVEIHSRSHWRRIGFRIKPGEIGHRIKQWIPTAYGQQTRYVEFFTEGQVEPI